MVKPGNHQGLPRSLIALNAFMAVVDERMARGIDDIVGKEASPVPPAQFAKGRDERDTGRLQRRN